LLRSTASTAQLLAKPIGEERIMIAATVDTNILRDYLEPARQGHATAQSLMLLDVVGACELRIVSRYKADIPGGELRAKFDSSEICRRPTVPSIAVWDQSDWDDDFWATPEQAREFDALLVLIFPGSDAANQEHANRVKDIGHLIGHKIANRDIFVTNDKAFAGQATALLRDHGIKVMNAAAAVRWICDQRVAHAN